MRVCWKNLVFCVIFGVVFFWQQNKLPQLILSKSLVGSAAMLGDDSDSLGYRVCVFDRWIFLWTIYIFVSTKPCVATQTQCSNIVSDEFLCIRRICDLVECTFLTLAFCLVVTLGLALGLDLDSIWLVSDYAHIFVLLPIVIATFHIKQATTPTTTLT